MIVKLTVELIVEHVEDDDQLSVNDAMEAGRQSVKNALRFAEKEGFHSDLQYLYTVQVNSVKLR